MSKKKRTKRISIALGTAAVLLLCFSCAGCGEKKAEEWTLTPTSTPSTGAIIEVTPTLHRAYPQGDPSPLEIERDYSAYDEGYVLYPKVISGNYADKISAHGGAISKRRLLTIEGAHPTVSKTLFEVLLPPVAPPRPHN